MSLKYFLCFRSEMFFYISRAMFISIFVDVTCEARSPGRRHAGPIELVVWAVAVAVAGEAVPRPRPRHPDRVFWNISADCGSRCSHCVAILCCKRLATGSLLLLLLAAQSRRKLEDVLGCLPGLDRRGCAVLRYNIYITIQQTGLCWTISTSLALRMPEYLKYIF